MLQPCSILTRTDLQHIWPDQVSSSVSFQYAISDIGMYLLHEMEGKNERLTAECDDGRSGH